ncbi:MAG: methylated-DNA--[protein]-cysteine S-methyltransferase [Fimbriimonadaceae bacterium]|nr:methylated-DNA--[protein]-cysteine S-methyltransferase [Fimbriimonadaceae bacterium]
MTRRHIWIYSPLGPLQLVADEGERDALVGLYFANHTHPPQDPGLSPEERVRIWGEAGLPADPLLEEVQQELEQYFWNPRHRFTVPIALDGTEFQRQVWDALLRIKAGETWTYGQVAEAIGRPDAVRAVGAAVGRNPVSILVPCHRVVGAAGDLTGYAGGVANKSWLLRHEGAVLT